MSDRTIYSEPELLERVARGDQQAFTQLFDHYSVVIYPYLLYWLKDRPVVEEVMQEVFLGIWQMRGKLAGMANFRGYLYVSARNKANTLLKQQLMGSKETSLYSLDKLVTAPRNVLEEKELHLILEQGIAALPPRRREIFLLHRQEQLTYDQIARRLGISRHTVKEHMIAALVFMKYYVKEHAGIIICWLVWLMVRTISH